jgi:hypothetical protein
MSGWTDVWNLIQEAASGASIAGGGSTAAYESQLTQPNTVGSTVNTGAQAAGGAWGAITGFLVAIADWHLWASLGWVLLGIALIVIGLRMWAGKNVLPPVPPIVPV